VPNGVDYELFAAATGAGRPDDVALAPPVVTFAGNLSKRVDPSLLDAVAERSRSVLLIGPQQTTFDARTIEGLLARPNVQWLPGRPYETLPAYFGASAVGVVPYTDTAFNRASFPLKVLEYLAAGLPVVSTDLPAVRWLGTDLVRVANDPEAFADAVDAAVAEADDPVRRRARQDLARAHDWRERVATLAAVLGLQPATEPAASA
jgi:teichuronic acid biosynthesis glycosyltransferase TuaH